MYYGKKKGDNLSISENIKYTYDKMGNICRIDENGAPMVWYQYDALNRLIREDNKTFGKTWLYSYDNKGNIVSKRTTNFTLKEDVEECEFESVQYEYDGDKLLSYGTVACAYDAIGNPTTYRGKGITWANGRQMTSYGSTAFTYDGLGRRLSKGEITYTYDSSNRVIKQSNGIEFIYDNSGVAGIVYNNATYLYRKDAQGNICALIDSSGNIVVQYKYDAWGNHSVQDANGADINDASHIGSVNPFRYRGYYYDTETGLYYLKSRYYDPEVGRFITIDDTSYLDPETINGLNLYAYCGNNPVMRVDENGNKWWHWLLGAVVLIGLAVSVVVTAGAAGVGIGAAFAAGFSGISIVAGVGGSATAAIACTILTSAFAGATVAAGLGMVAGGITFNSGTISWSWSSASEGFGFGALFGAFSGAALSTPVLGGLGKGFTKQLVQMGINSFLSGTFSVLQGLATGNINGGDVYLSAIFGALSGVLGATSFSGKASQLIQTLFLSFVISAIESFFSELGEYIIS